MAAPLPIGVTSQAELADIFCTEMVSPHFFTAAVSRQLPAGVDILQVYPAALTMPSLQSQVRYADYRIDIGTQKRLENIKAALSKLLSLKHLLWQHRRDTGTRSYDLRALINDLWLIDWYDGSCAIGMRLRCDNSGSGRPEQVVAALGFTHYPQLIHRTGLILEA
jgi:radical SAM-linked protein